MAEASQANNERSPFHQMWYVIESDSGLLITQSPEYGRHFVFWTTRELAEEMCKQYTGPLPLHVSEISLEELYGQFKMSRDAGMRYVLMDRKPDGGRIVPINEAIEVYGKMVAVANLVRPSSADEFVRLLDGRRGLGIQTSKDDEYMPIDCPKCGKFFSVHEVAYRQWRDGQMRDMLCPACLSTFQEAPVARINCRCCGAQSGYMPVSLCSRFHESHGGWQCQECGSRQAKQELLSRVSSRQSAPASPPGSSGCLLLALGVAVVSLVVWFA